MLYKIAGYNFSSMHIYIPLPREITEEAIAKYKNLVETLKQKIEFYKKRNKVYYKEYTKKTINEIKKTKREGIKKSTKNATTYPLNYKNGRCKIIENRRNV
ncbi:MAG: hypothetical protein ACPLRZ_11625 [Thermovenabulum sp.]|uniref:hypothetical protein n=1 Tax=Thermovenabulum sp. TaxID=3100335 RepID=UPI003C7B5A1C